MREDWTEKHRNVARKMFLEGRWTQKRLFDIGWSDASHCQACQMEEGTEQHRVYHCPEWHEIRREIQEAFKKWEQKGGNVEERVEAEGFKGHVATDSSLLGNAGKLRACG